MAWLKLTLQTIERHETGSDFGFSINSRFAEFVLSLDLESVIDILTGNNPKNQEGST